MAARFSAVRVCGLLLVALSGIAHTAADSANDYPVATVGPTTPGSLARTSTSYAQVAAQTPEAVLWSIVEPQVAQSLSLQARRSVPARYSSLRLNVARLEELLAQVQPPAGLDASLTEVDISLPWPDGSLRQFRVREVSIMEPALSAAFPGLRTYRGQGVNDPTAVAIIDWTPAGFHAMVLSAAGTIFIDPYTPFDRDYYFSYFKADVSRNAIPTFDEPSASSDIDIAQAQPPHGTQLRGYRLAVAATAEYTAAHGGTIAGAMNAIVTTVNRVNGIYERDVAVRLVLVNGNDRLVYLDPNTDPYTNNNVGVMVCENATNLDTVIGSANYDIGHVFGVGSGGFAPGRVCDNANACGVTPGSSKARGATTGLSPQGDPFDVDYVAHEIGHQFGGRHTFNASTGGSCNALTRTAATAFEPGSGSTIMAYTGICAAENLQAQSDSYFHAASQEDIIAFISNLATGGSCGTSVATGNTPPTASAGLDYTVPSGTPFTLTAQASDINGDYLTYAWEEMDLGAAAPPNTDDGSRPIFRSFSPVPSPARTFPRLADILSNTQTIGESLPTTTRTMRFQVTVRDNRISGGGTATDEMNLNIRADIREVGQARHRRAP